MVGSADFKSVGGSRLSSSILPRLRHLSFCVFLVANASGNVIEKITVALGLLAVKQAFAANAVSCLLTNDAYQLKISLTDFLWFDILTFFIS